MYPALELVLTPDNLARELTEREFAVSVLSGYSNYPKAKKFSDYRQRWRKPGQPCGSEADGSMSCICTIYRLNQLLGDQRYPEVSMDIS